MPIRWSALKVKEATDKVEEIVAPVLEPLERAKQVAIEAEKIPNLPDYVKERLARLAGELERVTGGIQSWDKKPYKGNIHRAIDAIRESLPKGDLAKEQANFQKWLDLFDGDREKAEVAMGIVKPEPKPKETPKEQERMTLEPVAVSTAVQAGYNPVSEAMEFVNKGEIGGKEPEAEGKEICYECGRSVAPGSGAFVNRIPSLDSQEERREMGMLYPEGGYLCDECDTLVGDEEEPIDYYLNLSPEERTERGIPEDFEKRVESL